VSEAQSTEERRTVEEWAEAAGFLPQFSPSAEQARVSAQPLDGHPGVVGIRSLGAALSAARGLPNPRFGHFAAARAYHRWPIGAELTRAEFDAAVAAAMTHPMG